MTRHHRVLATVTCVAVLTVGCAERSGPGAPRTDAGPPTVGDRLDPEVLGSVPPVPAALLEFRNTLQADFGTAPELGQTGLDGDVLTVHWHDEPPPALLDLVEAYREAPFEIRLEGTEFLPGDLLAEAGRLVSEHPGVVTGAGPRTSGDGVVVHLDPEVAGNTAQDTLRRLGVTSAFPLFPELVAAPVPAVLVVPAD